MNWISSVVSMELRKIFAYRSDFWVSFLGQTLVQLIVATALWTSIYESQNTNNLNGFSLETMILYYLIVPLGTKVLMGENIGFLSREIYDGTFTRYLIYPLDPFQYKTVTYLTYSMFFALQLLLIYSSAHLFFSSIPTTPEVFTNLLLGILLFFTAAVAFMFLSMAIELISLWADNIWTLMVLLRFLVSFLGGGLIPLTFMPEWIQKILSFTPFPYFISLPTQTILGKTGTEEIQHGFLILGFWIIFFFLLVKLIWRSGSKQYSGVGI